MKVGEKVDWDTIADDVVVDGLFGKPGKGHGLAYKQKEKTYCQEICSDSWMQSHGGFKGVGKAIFCAGFNHSDDPLKPDIRDYPKDPESLAIKFPFPATELPSWGVWEGLATESHREVETYRLRNGRIEYWARDNKWSVAVKQECGRRIITGFATDPEAKFKPTFPFAIKDIPEWGVWQSDCPIGVKYRKQDGELQYYSQARVWRKSVNARGQIISLAEGSPPEQSEPKPRTLPFPASELREGEFGMKSNNRMDVIRKVGERFECWNIVNQEWLESTMTTPERQIVKLVDNPESKTQQPASPIAATPNPELAAQILKNLGSKQVYSVISTPPTKEPTMPASDNDLTVKQLKDIDHDLIKALADTRRGTGQRFPFWFSLLGTGVFGVGSALSAATALAADLPVFNSGESFTQTVWIIGGCMFAMFAASAVGAVRSSGKVVSGA